MKTSFISFVKGFLDSIKFFFNIFTNVLFINFGLKSFPIKHIPIGITFNLYFHTYS